MPHRWWFQDVSRRWHPYAYLQSLTLCISGAPQVASGLAQREHSQMVAVNTGAAGIHIHPAQRELIESDSPTNLFGIDIELHWCLIYDDMISEQGLACLCIWLSLPPSRWQWHAAFANRQRTMGQQDVFMPAVDVELGEMIIHTNHIWSSWSGKKIKDALKLESYTVIWPVVVFHATGHQLAAPPHVATLHSTTQTLQALLAGKHVY